MKRFDLSQEPQGSLYVLALQEQANPDDVDALLVHLGKDPAACVRGLEFLIDVANRLQVDLFELTRN